MLLFSGNTNVSLEQSRLHKIYQVQVVPKACSFWSTHGYFFSSRQLKICVSVRDMLLLHRFNTFI
jgi:hypothetical protein